uniref:39S ribosomal protein L28, mitochondrial n=1 Tax=Angiostrongylus cantonensis TaxID=6313 RepID=A0A0K0CUB9_ANGCA
MSDIRFRLIVIFQRISGDGRLNAMERPLNIQTTHRAFRSNVNLIKVKRLDELRGQQKQNSKPPVVEPRAELLTLPYDVVTGVDHVDDVVDRNGKGC